MQRSIHEDAVSRARRKIRYTLTAFWLVLTIALIVASLPFDNDEKVGRVGSLVTAAVALLFAAASALAGRRA